MEKIWSGLCPKCKSNVESEYTDLKGRHVCTKCGWTFTSTLKDIITVICPECTCETPLIEHLNVVFCPICDYRPNVMTDIMKGVIR